jgi:hypothetical protein
LIENTQRFNNTTEIVIACKNYNLIGGMSHNLHNSQMNETFQVKALMGKGLDLKKDGTYVAFVGGTGVLVFMDLMALILR